VSLNVREKHEQNLIYWVLPLLLAVVAFAFAASISELLKFAWPNLKLHYYLGFFTIIISFIGYFSTAHPEEPSKKRSLIPELFALIVLCKLYTFFVLPREVFFAHLKLRSFLEANFIFAFILHYFVWRLAREAGKLAATINATYIDRALLRKYDDSYVGKAEKVDITGRNLVKTLFLPMLLLLLGVVLTEQSFQVKMAEASFLRLAINLFGALLAAATIAVVNMMLYLRKTHDWDRENATVDEDLAVKWIAWTLLFVLLFSFVAAIMPDDLSPVYFYLPNAIKALLPFIHSDNERGGQSFYKRDLPRPDIIPEEGELIVKDYRLLYMIVTVSIRIAIFLLVLGAVLYHFYKIIQENADDLPSFLRKIIHALAYFGALIKNLFKKSKLKTQKQSKLISEQLGELFKRRKIVHNKVQLNEIRRLYAELLIEAKEKGIEREGYKTAREFGLVLEELFPERIKEIVSLTELYQDARYNYKEPDQAKNLTAKGIFHTVKTAIKNYTRKKEQQV